jgi:hypothetical protein
MGTNKSARGKASGCIPTLNEVVIFFDQKGLGRKAAEAFLHPNNAGNGKRRKAYLSVVGKRSLINGYGCISWLPAPKP